MHCGSTNESACGATTISLYNLAWPIVVRPLFGSFELFFALALSRSSDALCDNRINVLFFCLSFFGFSFFVCFTGAHCTGDPLTRKKYIILIVCHYGICWSIFRCNHFKWFNFRFAGFVAVFGLFILFCLFACECRRCLHSDAEQWAMAHVDFPSMADDRWQHEPRM